MKSRLLCQGSALLLCCLSQLVWTANAQHAHIYAGATNQTPGTPLWFVNGDLWDTNSYGGYAQSPACIFLERNIPDFYPGLYQSATTFSALPATIFTGGPSPNAAALGTYVELRFVSLQGPPGGALAPAGPLPRRLPARCADGGGAADGGAGRRGRRGNKPTRREARVGSGAQVGRSTARGEWHRERRQRRARSTNSR
jgi:hypothetical protein